MGARRILWVTTKWPLPVLDGARHATTSALNALSDSGEQIDLLSFVDLPISNDAKHAAQHKLGLKNVYVIRKSLPMGKFSRGLNIILSTLFNSSLPFTVFPFKVDTLNVLKENTSAWTHIVFDGLHGAASFLPKTQLPNFRNVKFVYRAHNLESNLWEQTCLNANWLTKIPLRIQARKIREFEKGLITNCDAIAPVSNQDLQLFEQVYSLPLAKVIPVGFNFDNRVIPPAKNSIIKLLFVGSFKWRPNSEGITWFLREVWPRVIEQRADISITIVGKDTKRLRPLAKTLKRIEILDEVDNLDEIYESCHASIVPIFTGSGTRVKAIESCRFGRPCISTRLGVEGLPLADKLSFFKAESKEDWIKALLEVNEEYLEMLGLNAFNALKAEFDAQAVGQQLIELFNSI